MYEIQLGDIFWNEKNEDFYLLIKTTNKIYEAVSLTGMRVWCFGETLDEVKLILKESVDAGRLIHYSQDIYQLMIDKI